MERDGNGDDNNDEDDGVNNSATTGTQLIFIQDQNFNKMANTKFCKYVGLDLTDALLSMVELDRFPGWKR